MAGVHPSTFQSSVYSTKLAIKIVIPRPPDSCIAWVPSIPVTKASSQEKQQEAEDR